MPTALPSYSAAAVPAAVPMGQPAAVPAAVPMGLPVAVPTAAAVPQGALPVTTGDIVLITGTPVAGGAAASSSAATSMPPLREACEFFKRELGVNGKSLVDVVDATCELLGITDVKGDSLMRKAEKCWVCINGQ